MYTVYLVAYVGVPRDHHAIFVETRPDRSGHLFHLIGNIQNGMAFQNKPGKDPRTSNSYLSMTCIGTVKEEDYSRILPVVEAIPPPAKQFEKNQRLYPNTPLRRCQEWAAEGIEALKREGIVQTAEKKLENEEKAKLTSTEDEK